MAQWVKFLLYKPNSLSFIPQISQWKERIDSPKVSSDLHVCVIACMSAHIHAHSMTIIFVF